MTVGNSGLGPGGGPSRRAVEVATAVIVAVIVASGVVAVGAATRDEPQAAADPGPAGSPSEQPDTDAETSPPAETTATPEQSPTRAETAEPAAEPAVEAEVTEVELDVDQREYTGRCPVTLEFNGRVTTNTGPVRVDVEWRDADASEVEGERVQFGGPGPDAEPVPQGADVTHQVEVADDATIQRTLAVIDPNEIASDPVEATVACTPYAEITKSGDTFDAGLGLCHELHFDATITAPHNMTVVYEWLRSDGATDTSGPHTVEFTDGGTQTKSIPGKTWNVGDLDGQYGYRIHIIEPYDVMSDSASYEVDGCLEPAT